jgi:hypothetical protein
VTASGSTVRSLALRAAHLSLALTVVVAVVVPRGALAVLPPNPDQGLFIAIGDVLKRGGVVGRDTWDNKPPGAYYLYAAVLMLAPEYSETCTIPGGPLPISAYKLSCAQIVLAAFDALYALLLVAIVWWIGQRLFGPTAGALAALLCAIFGGMLQILNGGGSPDFFALLPSTLAYASALRYAESDRIRWLVLAGALGSIAVLFKQTGAVLLAGIGVWLLLAGSFWKSARLRWATMRACAALTIGAGGVLALAASILALVGALPDVVDQALLFNRYYVASPANVNNFFAQIAAQTWRVFAGSQSGLWLAAFGGFASLRGRTRDRRISLLVAWIAASACSLIFGGAHLLDYYYLALIPAFSVCGGLGLARLWHSSGSLARVWLLGTAATLLAYASQLQMHQYGNAWYSRLVSTTHSSEEFVAGSIKGGSGSLFVWGNGAQVYALSGRRPASRYLHTLALSYDYARHDRLEQNRAELMATLASAPPEVIAVDTPWLRRAKTVEFPELRALLARDYELTNSPSNPIFEGWEVYQRRRPPAN